MLIDVDCHIEIKSRVQEVEITVLSALGRYFRPILGRTCCCLNSLTKFIFSNTQTRYIIKIKVYEASLEFSKVFESNFGAL